MNRIGGSLVRIHARMFDIFGFKTTISACFRVVTMVDGLPRAFTSSRQNLHLYQSLTHAHGELLKHRFEKALAAPRSGFIGGFFVWIFGFSALFGFRSVFGRMSSGIVLDTRAVFSNAGSRVQDLHYVLILVNFGIICGPEFSCI